MEASGKLAKDDYLKVDEDTGEVSEALLEEFGVKTLFGTSGRYAPPPVIQLQPEEIIPLPDNKDPAWVKKVKFWTFEDAYRLMHPGIWVEHFDLVRRVWTSSDYAGSDPLVIAKLFLTSMTVSRG